MMNITIEDFIGAVRENGLPKSIGLFLTYPNNGYTGEPIAGCAYGQAARNRKINSPGDLMRAVEAVSIHFSNLVIALNDDTPFDLPQIADILFVFARREGIINTRLNIEF